jgi:hypothetical protein
MGEGGALPLRIVNNDDGVTFRTMLSVGGKPLSAIVRKLELHVSADDDLTVAVLTLEGVELDMTVKPAVDREFIRRYVEVSTPDA